MVGCHVISESFRLEIADSIFCSQQINYTANLPRKHWVSNHPAQPVPEFHALVDDSDRLPALQSKNKARRIVGPSKLRPRLQLRHHFHRPLSCSLLLVAVAVVVAVAVAAARYLQIKLCSILVQFVEPKKTTSICLSSFPFPDPIHAHVHARTRARFPFQCVSVQSLK